MPRFRRLSAAGTSALSIWELCAPLVPLRDLLGESLPTTVGALQLARHSFAFDEALCWCRALPADGSPDYTIEVHLHGGFGVAAALRDFLAARAWQEVPSILHEDLDLLQATSPLAARIFSARRDGAWHAALQQLPSVAAADRVPIVTALQHWNAWGQVLAEPPMVLLAGPPNAGKSTLFNAWLQERRVTASAAAGTTRDLISAPCQLGVGAEAFVVKLVDSAGLWEQARGVDQAAVAMSLAAIASAWRVIWLLDAATPPSKTLLKALATRCPEDLLVVNRMDLEATWNPQKILPRAFFKNQSRQSPQLITALEGALLRQLGPPPPVGQLVAVHAAERLELQALAATDSRR